MSAFDGPSPVQNPSEGAGYWVPVASILSTGIGFLDSTVVSVVLRAKLDFIHSVDKREITG